MDIFLNNLNERHPNLRIFYFFTIGNWQKCRHCRKMFCSKTLGATIAKLLSLQWKNSCRYYSRTPVATIAKLLSPL